MPAKRRLTPPIPVVTLFVTPNGSKPGTIVLVHKQKQRTEITSQRHYYTNYTSQRHSTRDSSLQEIGRLTITLC